MSDKKFPETLYVQQDDVFKDQIYLNADAEVDEMDDGPVAIYKLVEVKTKKSTITLE